MDPDKTLKTLKNHKNTLKHLKGYWLRLHIRNTDIRCITSKKPPLVAAAVVTRGGFLHVKKQGRGFLHVKTLKIFACGAIILPIYMFSGIYSSLNDLLVNILAIQVHY